MKLYIPIKKTIITQKFGKSGTKPEMVKFYNNIGLLFHNGFDFMVNPCNNDTKNCVCQPIYWDCDLKGKVIEVSLDNLLGHGVVILTQENGEYFKHRFWHMSEISVKVGQEIDTGVILGKGGNTGQYTTGAHLHRDLKPVAYNTNGIMYNLQDGNGYVGCIDIEPYFQYIFVLDLIKNLEGQISILKKIINLIKDFLKK